MVVIQLKHRDPETGEQKTREIAFHRMIPNMMTLMAMAAGLTSIQYAINMQWEKAVLAILLAAILDCMDGATARLLKASSEFGAQLDSLCDFLSFGVAPAVILYTWILEESGKVGWTAMIFFASAAALRLARFNLETKSSPKWHKGFFSGIPTPAAAGLALLPMILWLQYPDFFKQFSYVSPLIGLWTITIAAGMISRIPTFSVKAIRIPSKMGMPLLAGTALLIAALVHLPWPTLTVIACAYIASIPLSYMRFQRLEKTHEDDEIDLQL